MPIKTSSTPRNSGGPELLSGCYRSTLIFPDFSLFFLIFLSGFHIQPLYISPYHLEPPNAQIPSQSRPSYLMLALCWPHRSHMVHSLAHVHLMIHTCALSMYLTLSSWLASLPLHGCTDAPVIIMYKSCTSHVAQHII